MLLCTGSQANTDVYHRSNLQSILDNNNMVRVNQYLQVFCASAEPRPFIWACLNVLGCLQPMPLLLPRP